MRSARSVSIAAPLLATVLLAAGCGRQSVSPPPPPPPSGAVNVLTYHNDLARTGQNLAETILTPANVSGATFGKIGFLPVNGLVDAEPLYVSQWTIAGAAHNVVYVATEHDEVHAFDADNFTPLWSVSVSPAGEVPSDDHGCGQITPEIGVTDTPVIDPAFGAHGAIFLVAMSKDASGAYHQRLHAMDLATGAELPGSPVEIQARYTAPGSGVTDTFDPGNYAERAGLLLLNGKIYLAFTSHCDQGSYQGWVMAYDEATLRQTAVLNLTPNGSEGSVWMAGAGLAADAAGNVYFLDANGTFDTLLDAQGRPAQGDYGNAFLKLSTANGGLAVAGYFTPSNTVAESNADEDLGSGGVLVLPDASDAAGTVRHLAVGAGKDGNIYVVNRDSMGGFNAAGDAVYQEIGAGGLAGSVFSAPAYFNGRVYYAAVGDALKAFTVSSALLAAPPASQSAATFGYPGATPSVSANGAANGIVWVVENRGGAGILHAYDAANLAHELYNSARNASRDSFADNKFITPMIANGKVFVGTPTGVAVFGLLP
ncbi:MAG TPA: pyrrolo-quinoline quinone [Terriglobales bacterium]|nr:pyrrolo-quinoline quinone [Terriglobales bacterium]